MDQDIISTLITAVASVFVGFLGIIAGRKSQAEKAISEKTLLRALLFDIFTPLDRAFQNAASPNEILVLMERILNDCYVEFPPFLLFELSRLKQKPDLENKDFIPVREFVATNFEWLRKRLGYPYNKRRIVKKWSPKYERTVIVQFVLLIMLIMLWGMAAMITLTAIPTLIQSGSYNIFQEYSWAILLFIAGIPFVVEFLIAAHKK